jgi:hypothetical protein
VKLAMGSCKRIKVLSVVAIVLASLVISGCGKPSFTEKRYKSLVSSNDVVRQKVESTLGSGDAIKNEYTDEQIELHDLPKTTTFLRWQHPDDPTTYSFIGFSNDKAVHFTTLHAK